MPFLLITLALAIGFAVTGQVLFYQAAMVFYFFVAVGMIVTMVANILNRCRVVTEVVSKEVLLRHIPSIAVNFFASTCVLGYMAYYQGDITTMWSLAAVWAVHQITGLKIKSQIEATPS